MNQLFNKAKKPMARYLATRWLTPDLRKKIARNDDAIETAATIAAIITPHGGWWEITDENFQDFVHEVVEVCKEIVAAGNDPKAVTLGAPAFDAAKQRQRLALVATKIADRSKRDDFIVWFGDLTTNPAKATDLQKFLGLVAEITADDEVKNLIEQHPNDLNTLLAMLPDPATSATGPALTYAALRTAIAKDPALPTRVAGFLTATKTDENRFWQCVEARINTFEEFEATMALLNDEIITYLGLVPWSETLDQTWNEVKDWWNKSVKPDLDATAKKAKTDLDKAITDLKQTRQDINDSSIAKGIASSAEAHRQKWADKLNLEP